HPCRPRETPPPARRHREGTMSSRTDNHDRDHLETACLYALRALPATEASAVEAHLSTCAQCRQEVETTRSVVESFVSWPTDVLRPSGSVWDRVANRIAGEARQALVPASPSQGVPEWEAAAPGISVKLLASDTEHDRVSMLVRLAPGAAYPPHRHD